VLRTQRDSYANLNNQVLHLANQSVTINEIQNVYNIAEEPRAAHCYHCSEAHNSRAVINRYLGYWDAHPAMLIPLSPRDSAPLYVEMMGGADKIMAKGKELYDQGKYRYAVAIRRAGWSWRSTTRFSTRRTGPTTSSAAASPPSTAGATSHPVRTLRCASLRNEKPDAATPRRA